MPEQDAPATLADQQKGNNPMSIPYRVLFSNDTTNILTCKSPYNERAGMGLDPATGKPTYHPCGFDASKLEATVDEIAGQGIDVHMLQPGVGWVPWWKSRHYPYAEHVRFMKEQTGMQPSADPFAAYMAAGGDMVEVFTRRCRRHGMAPFVSFRLNDSHGHEFLAYEKKDIPSWAWHCFSTAHVNHPEWRLGSDLNDWNNRVLNWAIPEVVAHKLAFIEEIIAQYDLDGFELDFMRHCKFFRDDGPALAERLRIMLDFVGKVRAALDRREAADGRHRHLCVRIPAFEATHAELGIDVAEFAKAGVEMFNLSYYYFTGQQGDFAALRRQAPEAAFYVEMCHCTSVQNIPNVPAGYDNFRFRRTTPNQYYTTAHLAYARGLQGVSTFNFVYYREHGIGDRGPFDEPPFEIHRGCADPAFVARQPQHYFIGHTWIEPKHGRFPLNDNWAFRAFSPGKPATFQIDMATPSGGWQVDGRLRIQSPEDLGDSRWRAVMNGVELKETTDRSEPYANPYSPLLGTPAQHRAWIVPAHVCKDGINLIEITLVTGDEPLPVVFLDVAMPVLQASA
jgi:hypothetical protein